MAKRFTDSEKWEDPFFTNLSNDEKVIWIYLLDHCDNAGVLKINIKNINYFCITNITVEELFIIFQGRLTRISVDTCIINKFCIFQYGPDFLKSNNKAVQSAIKKLIEWGIVQLVGSSYTLSIPYQYSIDSPKEEEEVKEQVKIEDKVKYKVKDKVKDKVMDKDFDKEQIERSIQLNDKIPSEYKEIALSILYGDDITISELDSLKQNKHHFNGLKAIHKYFNEVNITF